MKYYVDVEGKTLEFDFEERGDLLVVRHQSRELRIDLRQVRAPSLYSLLVDHRSYEVFIDQEQGEQEGEYHVLIEGEQYKLTVQDEWARRLATIQRRAHIQAGELPIKAPMPGYVVAVLVKPGQRVERGQGLVILSAMKMENEIKAPRAGTVQSANVEAGQTVEQGRVLLVLA
ncbi:MAG: biotin/lipoyl-binding protein [Chloroflexi bacterium]|nr:biotin/lipoyl-binding protein [Chloroflexota bacterium]